MKCCRYASRLIRSSNELVQPPRFAAGRKATDVSRSLNFKSLPTCESAFPRVRVLRAPQQMHSRRSMEIPAEVWN
eukprot:6185479-Pleurochrysis_carterae.AAC.2